MKIKILIMFMGLGLGSLVGYAQKIIAELPVDQYLPSDQDQKDLFANFRDGSAPSLRLTWKQEDKAYISFPKESDETTGLLLVRTGPGIDRTALLAVPTGILGQITGTRYGIMGEVSYSGVNRGALSMASCFSRAEPSAPLDLWYGDGEGLTWGGHDASMGLMEGTRDWGTFFLGFNREFAAQAQHSELKLKRLVLNVVMEGPGTVHVRHLKLVQYPEENTVTTFSFGGMNWPSFGFGVATVGLVLFAAGGLLFISRRWNRRRHEHELRRMASLDG